MCRYAPICNELLTVGQFSPNLRASRRFATAMTGFLRPLATLGRTRAALWVGLSLVCRALPAGAGGSPTAIRHWAFQPLSTPPVPVVRQGAWPRTALDRFVLAQLEQVGLSPSDEATPLERLRRVHLDLTGLPPTPEQVAAFLSDPRGDAWERVVEELLQSPRYGERWAQPWLDLVRYADTDGFEVNTERRHAWPYRDYVIRALNQDIPYDRFIREQLAGDVLGEDAATGFLVTAAALLPGQIGADDVSKRLARQDSLSEIVSGTGDSFLALSIGCARCHDHKFDPIPQRDFYSIQAFFAGVQYGERPIHSPATEANLRQADALQLRVAELEQALAQFEPLARKDLTPRRETQARLNEEVFPARPARYVRFTIHGSNRHPTLGVIEPCLDEFEIFTDEETPRNVALAAYGTRVTASGSRNSGEHRLEHVHDGRYGNGHSWMSDEAGQGWLLFELPEAHRLRRITWSRDREGVFSDRLATSYTLEAGLTPDDLERLAYVPPLRRPVNPRLTSDRFAPVRARRVRFTITACTSLEPCLDELEVFTAGSVPRNIALSKYGTKATATSTLSGSPQQTLEHLNDGLPGNDHSWISGDVGRGTVELEFAQPELIERVVWARDREGKFTDRLPTAYRIEVADESGTWRWVAGSGDREAYEPGIAGPVAFTTAGLSAVEAQETKRLSEEKRSLEQRIAQLRAVPQVFGGIFGAPEPTHLLRRGDPEQPLERLAPAVLTVLGDRTLPADAPDPVRRKLLADWIASADNPLTARVLVNRIWQGHFGLGLVETASDFGRNGTPPSHPALLDWLAGDFIRSGWSIKHLHRLILNSATYRQSGRIRPAAQARDASCRWLWRFPTRRLEAETIRDAMLAVSGHINLQMGGAGFNIFRSRGGLDGFPPVESFREDGLRRLVYAHKVRMERDPVFGAFDCPDAGQGTPRRRQSTTPIQALNLFNSRFTLDVAEAFAARVRAEVGSTGDGRPAIRRAYQLAFGRDPQAAEYAAIEPVVRSQSLAALTRVLLNSNEFLFLP